MSIKLKDTIYDLVNKATKDGSGDTITSTYLKLSGGTLTGDLALNAGNEDRFLKFQYNNGDTYGWRIGYLGSGSGDANYLVIQTSQETAATWTNALRLGNTKGDALFSATVTANGGFIGTLTGNVTGNASSATKLATARTLWGQSFNGTANVSGNMTGVGTISMSGALTLTGTDSTTAAINFSRASYNYIHAPANGLICLQPSGMGATSAAGYHFNGTEFFPGANNTYTLGTSSKKWKNVYATTFTGSLSGNATSSDYTTYIRITSTNPTSATTYNPIWAVNSSATSDGTNDYTPRANNGFSYITLEGTESALGYGIVRLGNSTASGTAGNKYGMLRLYSESSGYINIRPGSASTTNYTLFLPGAAGQLVYHTNDTQIGAAATPVYVTSGGEISACSIGAGSGNSNRCLMVTNGSNGMYYTPTITGNYLNGALISTVSDTTTVRHTCTNSNGSVSLYAATNRGLYDNTNGAWIIYLTTAADHVYVSKWASKGSTTAPVYFNSSGEPTAGSTYAGGTKVTLNGTAKGATTASFYAPTGAGTSGQYLISSGGAPTWLTINPYDANISRTANTVLAAPNGSAGSATFRKLVAADLPSHSHSNFTVFGVAYNGSAAKTVTGETLVGTLSEGTSNLTDGTMLLTSYASDNGFADTNAPNKIYKRKASCVWGYIKGKTDAAYAPISHTHSYASSSHSHNFNQITDAPNVYLNAGTVTRRVLIQNTKNSQGYISRATIGLTNAANQFSPVFIGVGTNDRGTTFTDYYFAVGGSISDSKGNTYLSTANWSTYCAAKSHTHSYAASSHTHNYAGSSSAGGAATSANKLNTNAGSATKPVYFSGGVPVQVTGCMVQYWAIYEIFFGNNGTTSSRVKQAGNFDFLGSVITHERVGQIYIYVNYPAGFSEKTTMIFGNGDHVGSDHTDVGYLTIGKQVYGLETGSGSNAGRLRLSFSDDASTNWGYAYLYFLCIG